MIIKKIILNNFKVYYGEQVIDSSLETINKPLVLIGGHNGAGKTSIIEAIKLCLYGNNALSVQKGYRSYNSLLKKMHNKTALNKNQNYFSIEIVFEIQEKGINSDLSIKRIWNKNKDKYKEELILNRDGYKVEFIDKQYWQNYIDELTPYGLSELIYFDSEQFRKVPQFLENGFIPSLMNFFGLDNYTKLKTDLNRYNIHSVANLDPKIESEIIEIEKNINNLKSDKALIDNKKHHLIKMKADLNSTLNIKKSSLKKKTNKKALLHDSLIVRKAEINNILEALKDEYINLCSNQLPFSLCKNLSLQLINSLKKQIENNKIKDGVEYASHLKLNLIKKVQSNFSSSQMSILKTEFDDLLKLDLKKQEPVYDISNSKALSTIETINDSLKKSKKLLSANRTQYNELLKERDSINRELREIKPDGPLKAVLDEIESLNAELVLINDKLDKFPKEIEEIDNKINKKERSIELLCNKIERNTILNKKIEQSNRIQNLLDEYIQYLSTLRFDNFRKNFLEVINKLSRKKKLVNDIVLDPKLGKILFLDSKNNSMSVREFSAGESEIVALSILWAINKTSGKKHPIITDSPLNRLDKVHREKFIDVFIKNSDHQIIFLSTDEEIKDAKYYNIDPYINKYLLIEHNKEDKVSEVKEGYFDDK